jgi:hypothetical protein
LFPGTMLWTEYLCHLKIHMLKSGMVTILTSVIPVSVDIYIVPNLPNLPQFDTIFFIMAQK